MKTLIAPCTHEIISVIIGAQSIRCLWLKQTGPKQFSIKEHCITICSHNALAQPAIIENSIRAFLAQHALSDAFIALAVTTEQHDLLPEHQLLQCQLIAINTPFHCAGITTYAQAVHYATEQMLSVPHTADIAHEDLLCGAGLFLMATHEK